MLVEGGVSGFDSDFESAALLLLLIQQSHVQSTFPPSTDSNWFSYNCSSASLRTLIGSSFFSFISITKRFKVKQLFDYHIVNVSQFSPAIPD